MAAAFRPVNSSLTTESTADNVISPNSSSSLRPGTAPHSQHPQSSEPSATPTRATFSGSSMAGQQSLPYGFPRAVQAHESSEKSSRRDRSAKSPARTSKDVDMDESDGETATVEENPGSDDESVNADGSRSGSKKKKSQRFYCTDYPPCNLSFTRSEHLARHIRKHTGERPFKCHCQRRFSRLDNLRQHAQTVHVNENIPIDSLAATGSRFQRQIRTDRTRQAGNRARASTGGSAGGPARGHSKSLSTPNISTIASVGPAYSTQVDPRQRPTPIVMASDPRSRLSFDSYRGSYAGNLPFPQHSPDRFTPPSGYSASQTSPRRGPYSMSSSSHSRSQSLYSIENRPPSRRLSVPSGTNPFQLGHGQLPGRSSFGPALINSPGAGALPSPNSGLMPSPTMPSSDWSSRRDSISSVSDEALRRRTWHIETGGSTGYPAAGMAEDVRPDLLPPITRSSSPVTRLPGIASLVSMPRRPITPPRQRLLSMDVDAQIAPRPVQMEPVQTDERRNLNMYDVSLQRGLGRLDIGPRTPPRENVGGAWIPESSRAAHAQPDRGPISTSTVRFEEQPHPSYHANPSGLSGGRSLHQHTMSAPNLVPSRENRRHGWYHGPANYENGQQSPQEFRGPHVDRMLHPNLNGFSGFPAKDQPSQMQQQERTNNSDPLRRLEALVAVATSEGSTATAY